jgi:hypothetical protein
MLEVTRKAVSGVIFPGLSIQILILGVAEVRGFDDGWISVLKSSEWTHRA